jgi:hypothetical protein
MKKNYYHPTFLQYKKKNHINLFSLYSMKKKFIREKKLRGKKLKLEIS